MQLSIFLMTWCFWWLIRIEQGSIESVGCLLRQLQVCELNLNCWISIVSYHYRIDFEPLKAFELINFVDPQFESRDPNSHNQTLTQIWPFYESSTSTFTAHSVLMNSLQHYSWCSFCMNHSFYYWDSHISAFQFAPSAKSFSSTSAASVLEVCGMAVTYYY